jgi:BirA family transcriptional regulator, biotin operon repressor / biotin---[acetyl-CoA-carboxylase] ligase
MKILHTPCGLEIRWFDSVGSTNDEARTWAEQGAAEGSIVCADEQWAGRGRRGAVWVCPPGEALAFSQILRPTMPRALWPRLALVAGLAVAKTLEFHGLAAEVKWPNDVWVAGKKIAGILVESSGDVVIVGVGLNVNPTEFPPEIADSATSMKRETGVDYDREELLGRLARGIHSHARRVETEFSDLLAEMRERCALTGKRVSLLCGDEVHMVGVHGIGDRGELLIERNGRIEPLLQADQIRPLE